MKDRLNADNTTITAVDGHDALAIVIIRPGVTEGSVSLEAMANGIDKAQGAFILRHVADLWDAEAAKAEVAS